MEIAFKASLKKYLVNAVAARKKYGELAEKVMTRVSLLIVVESLADVPQSPPERMHELRENRAGQFAITVQGPVRLVFEPMNQVVPRDQDGQVQWQEIRAIRILEVGDYHE